MSQDIQEQLSALMDGELTRDEARFLLKRLDHDRALAASWSRYHVLRQVLRRQEIVAVRTDFASAVVARIDDEAASAHASRSAPWLRWVSGGAIAAAVAVAALVVTRPQVQAPPAGNAVASVAGPTAPVTVAPAEFHPPLLSPALPAQPAAATVGGGLAQPAAFDPRLQSYLIRHFEATGAAGQTGLVPYVLLVVPSRDANVRAQPENGGHR